jgi:MoxR-like ATPase
MNEKNHELNQLPQQETSETSKNVSKYRFLRGVVELGGGSPLEAEPTLADFEKTPDGFMDLILESETIKSQMRKNSTSKIFAQKQSALKSNYDKIQTKLSLLSRDENLRAATLEKFKDTFRTKREVLHYHIKGRELDRLETEESDFRIEFGDSQGTDFYEEEVSKYQSERDALATDREKILAAIPPDEKSMEFFFHELQRVQRRSDARELESGLLLTDNMKKHVRDSLPSLLVGKPVLFVGDTGGAKTALAKAISRNYIGKEPELVSFHGEINNYQLMGKEAIKSGNKSYADMVLAEIEKLDPASVSDKDKLRIEALIAFGGATATEFIPGPIVRAMQSGTPVILDEVNAASPEFLKRLNEIMLLRPGQSFRVQEDSGMSVEIQPGFCLLATANQKSARYKGVHKMSAEFINRFGADIQEIEFPDQNVVAGGEPEDNLRLAEAVLSGKHGDLPKFLPYEKLSSFVKAAHQTQKLFTGQIDGLSKNLPNISNSIVDDRPALEETVLSPRMMVSILEKVKNGKGTIDLGEQLSNWVKTINNKSDRYLITTIFKSHRLLIPVESNTKRVEEEEKEEEEEEK